MKRWMLAVLLGMFSFAALAADPPAEGDKAAKPTKKPKKKDAPKKDDGKKDDAAKPEAK